MKKRNLLLVILAILLVFGMVVGCGPVEEEDPVDVTFDSVAANGSASQTTTQLTLKFSEVITGLKADNITLTSTTGATKGTLTAGTGGSYTLAITGVTAGGSVSVSVAAKVGKFNISGSPKTVTIYFMPDLTDEKTYYGSYQAKYKASSATDAKEITETIVIDGNYFTIWDDDYTMDGTTKKPNNDYLRFLISDDWTNDTTPSDYSSTYPYAFKFEGRVTGGKPVSNTGTTYIFGTQTAPGFTQTDMTNSTPAYMKLYFDYTANGITFIRTTFIKKSDPNPNEAVVKWYTSGSNLRVFTKIPDATIPDYVQK